MKEKLKLNIAVCDDDAAALVEMETVCRQTLEQDYEVAVYPSFTAAEILKSDEIFQIALLDVNLPESNGIELARKLLMDNPECRIIFVSGHTSVVSDVYDVPHCCMILKDQIPVQLPKFLLRAAHEAAYGAGLFLQIRYHKKTENIKLSQIIFLERCKHITTINLLSGEKIEIHDKLSELTDHIACPYFCRCHISYVVNLERVKEMDGNYLKMVTGHQIPVSNTYKSEVRKAYGRYLCRHF